MKKSVFLLLIIFFSLQSYGQYRWELSGGITNSSFNVDNVETTSGIGYYFSAGYGYVMGVRAKTSVVFSLEALQRSSDLTTGFSFGDGFEFSRTVKFTTTQFGFSPKFRYLFFTGKDRFRPFINVGPSFRLNTNVKIGDQELEEEDYEQLMIGGVYGVGFSQMVGEMFDIFFEAGAMNDFLNTLKFEGVDNSKFFDVYARVGIRVRIYDARR